MSGLEQAVADRVNSVQDPCSLAQRFPIGMSDMGLLTDVRVDGPDDDDGSYDVHLVLRVTAPGCMYVPFMDRAVRTAVADLPQVASISTEWEPTADWTPANIAEPVRLRLEEARARRREDIRARRNDGAGALQTSS